MTVTVEDMALRGESRLVEVNAITSRVPCGERCDLLVITDGIHGHGPGLPFLQVVVTGRAPDHAAADSLAREFAVQVRDALTALVDSWDQPT